MSRTVQSLCIAALAFAALASPAAAETGRTHSGAGIQVFYGDLDTSSQAGAKVLVGRLNAAAREVCGADSQARGLTRLQQRTCQTNAVSRAVARINNPVVTQMLATSTGKPMIFASR